MSKHGSKEEAGLESAATHFERFLRSQELKLTSQRRDILELVSRLNTHFTAEELYEGFKGKRDKPSKATVYRTLSLLSLCGIVDEHAFDKQSSSVYEYAWGRTHHDHLVCLSCGDIIEFFSQGLEDLQDRVAESYEFTPVSHSLKIYGICSACTEKGVTPEKLKQ